MKKAMDMILTGRMMDDDEAERSGLVSRIYLGSELLDETMKIASNIASLSQSVVMIAKEAVNLSQETSLSQGIQTAN